MKGQREPDVEEWCAHVCECGSKGGQYLRHYGLMRCNCGRMFWALRPRRHGPLVLRPWPGYPKQDER
jgi:hypothetical protein